MVHHAADKKVAVLLCGSGYLDGSEIRESVAVLCALSEAGAEAQCFAPNAEQADVVNTLTGQAVSGEKRNMLTEAARIARGKVRPIDELEKNLRDYAAIVIPGGFGVAKNFCTFAFQGSKGTVRPEIARVLQSARANGTPIGAICISPALLALTFPSQGAAKGFELTVGAEGEASREIAKLGHRHVVRAANECHVDAKNRVVSTPAYMYDGAPVHEVFEGIRKLVGETLKLAQG